MRDVELLAPGGDVDSVKAAILAGASAVFLGVADFNARKRAKNISLQELEELVPLAHEGSVKLYVTLNTLFTESDLPKVVGLIEQLFLLGVDAIIVQDYGLLGVLQPYADQVEIHASTQMTTHNSAQIKALHELGVKQVNLSRELCLPAIVELNKSAHSMGINTEVFIHGAFCVSFSGQCYFSTHLYGLSGNKGSCVQPCRREFSGASVSSCSPFNLKDNAAYAVLKELVATGTDSLKIEGRVKSADYVHTVVKAYREQLDRVICGEQTEESSRALESVFNRDFTDGYLKGDLSKSMFTVHSKDQSLEKVGTVVTYGADRRELKLKSVSLQKGAELHIKDKHNQFVCKGRVKRVLSDNSYHFVIEDKMQGRIYKGYTVFQKPQECIDQNLSEKIAAMKIAGTSITLSITAMLGKPLEIRASSVGRTVILQSSSVLQEASARPLSLDVIKEKMGKLGGTDFSLGEVTVQSFDETLFLPIKELNEMKRQMVQLLSVEEDMTKPLSIKMATVDAKEKFNNRIALCINSANDIALGTEVDALLFEMPLTITDEIKTLFQKNRVLIPWFQPILSEQQFTEITGFISAIGCEKIVAENSGLILWAKEHGVSVISGQHLNCTNSQAVQTLSQKLGAEGVFLSKELSAEQLSAVKIPAGVDLWYPLVEHELLMNTKQCLIRNTLGCKKQSIDETCLLGCDRSTFVKEKQDREISVMKRKGFHNQIFANKMKYHRDEASVLKNRVDYWLLDLRDMQSRTHLTTEKSEVIKRAKNEIQQRTPSFISCFENIDSKPVKGLQ